MNLATSIASMQKALIGNDAAWHLVFKTPDGNKVLSRGRADYDGSIDATLPGGLEPGAYHFVIEGITNDDYQAIKSKENDGLTVDLYLYWRDAAGSVAAYAANLAGLTDALDAFGSDPSDDYLVAKLSVVSVKRRLGSRRYEAAIEARELVYDRLQAYPKACYDSDDPYKLFESLVRSYGLQPVMYPLALPGQQDAPPSEPAQGDRLITDTLRDLARRVEDATNRHGRGMAVIRRGKLHFGPNRPFPLEGDPDDPKKLRLENGLVEVQGAGVLSADPNWDATSAKPGAKPPSLPQYELILKGRPDILPGDVVMVVLPDEDQPPGPGKLGFGSAVVDLAQGMFGGGGDPDFKNKGSTIYVSSVSHRLSRDAGFVTRATGVVIKDVHDPWDHWTPRGVYTPPERSPPAAGDDRAAKAVSHAVQRMTGARRLGEVGEVRQSETQSGQDLKPATSVVWRGLVPGDGGAFQARRLEIDRKQYTKLPGVPYLTPFAWGKCGLVLPRYPGTRVFLEHRNGFSEDPVDIGALWKTGDGPDAQAGDWWLTLPAEVPQSDRSKMADADTPQPYDKKVSNDLIDADGNRVIEVGTLTVRIGTSKLASAGTRPQAGDTPVVVEHEKGSKITIDSDGNVTIESAAKLTLKAADDVEIIGNNIKVSPQNGGTMDVG